MKYLMLALSLSLVFPALADTIRIPVGQQGIYSGSVPTAGMISSAVLQHFGSPSVKHSPVGNPAITRWDYRGFSVYCEGDRVISSVRQHTLSYPQSNP